MKVLVAGHSGYIGQVLVRLLTGAGYDLTRPDTDYFSKHQLGAAVPTPLEVRRKETGDLDRHDLVGFDAAIHLAALSNDPRGNLNPELTYDVNLCTSVRLATLAKEAGVERFLYASSCGIRGVSDGEPATRSCR